VLNGALRPEPNPANGEPGEVEVLGVKVKAASSVALERNAFIEVCFQ
jgi:hypothetical protein